FSVVTKYHKGRHSLFLYNSEIFYAFTQDILRSLTILEEFESHDTNNRTRDIITLVSLYYNTESSLYKHINNSL
ncbi:hypothetical protein FU657_15935, partial [Lactiplantibacillus plantarum]